jgi:hypothetical protein
VENNIVDKLLQKEYIDIFYPYTHVFSAPKSLLDQINIPKISSDEANFLDSVNIEWEKLSSYIWMNAQDSLPRITKWKWVPVERVVDQDEAQRVAQEISRVDSVINQIDSFNREIAWFWGVTARSTLESLWLWRVVEYYDRIKTVWPSASDAVRYITWKNINEYKDTVRWFMNMDDEVFRLQNPKSTLERNAYDIARAYKTIAKQAYDSEWYPIFNKNFSDMLNSAIDWFFDANVKDMKAVATALDNWQIFSLAWLKITDPRAVEFLDNWWKAVKWAINVYWENFNQAKESIENILWVKLSDPDTKKILWWLAWYSTTFDRLSWFVW